MMNNNWRKTLLHFFILLTLFLPIVHANAEPYSLRGIQLGISVKNFKTIPYPDPNKYKMNKGKVLSYDFQNLCTGNSKVKDIRVQSILAVNAFEQKIGMKKCNFFWHTIVTEGEEYTIETPFFMANLKVKASFDFIPSATKPNEYVLFRISIDHPLDRWHHLTQALSKKYGEPTEHESTMAQNAFGTRYERHTARWRRDGSTISVWQNTTDLKKMNTTYTLDRELSRIADLKSKFQGDPSDNL